MIPFHIKNYLEIALTLVFVVLATLISRPLGFVMLHIAGLICWMARDTKRYFIKNTSNYIAPIDGIVQSIENGVICPHKGGIWKKVIIKTGLADSHIQYSPIGGTITSQLIHEKGNITIYDVFGHWFAYILKRNFTIPIQFIMRSLLITIIDGENYHCIVETYCNHGIFNLLSGLSRANEYGFSEQGDKLAIAHIGYYNMITNLYLPENTSISVRLGQTIVGSETVIASESNLENRIAAE